MLKHEEVVVEVEGWSIASVDPEESADLRDELRAENPDMGARKFDFTLSREMFAKRVIAWPYTEECSDDNKRVFFRMYWGKSIEVISAAQDKIEEKRNELLGNLSVGATGT